MGRTVTAGQPETAKQLRPARLVAEKFLATITAPDTCTGHNDLER